MGQEIMLMVVVVTILLIIIFSLRRSNNQTNVNQKARGISAQRDLIITYSMEPGGVEIISKGPDVYVTVYRDGKISGYNAGRNVLIRGSSE